MFLSNFLSGSGGKYDTTKEDEVKKVHCENFFPLEVLHMNFNLMLRLFEKVTVHVYYTVPIHLF